MRTLKLKDFIIQALEDIKPQLAINEQSIINWLDLTISEFHKLKEMVLKKYNIQLREQDMFIADDIVGLCRIIDSKIFIKDSKWN